MQDAPIEIVYVLGSGIMGLGIARTFAGAGFAVTAIGPEVGAIAEPPHGVTLACDLPEAAPDLIIEAVPEVLEIKREVFARCVQRYGERPILASNTSGLPLAQIAAGLAAPQRFVGMHYFHPPEVFAAVEVARIDATSPETVARVVAALRRTDREAIVIDRPTIGLVVNRLQHAMLHEAYHMIAAGIADAQSIDAAARLLLGPRMSVTGLVLQKDLGGLEIHARAQRSIVPDLDHSRVPNPLLQELVERGESGANAGLGFYDWRDVDVPAYRERVAARLRDVLAAASAGGGEAQPRVRGAR